jgi:hypothetical protein
LNSQNQFLDEILSTRLKLRDLYFQHYAQHEIFSWTWFIEIALIFFPLLIWWKLVDKKRLLEICVFGLIVNMMAAFLDVAGSDYVLWEYPAHVLPQVALLIPVDYVIVPTIGMFVYQRFSTWRSFIIVSIIMSAFMAFLCEPFAVLINMYRLISWRYIYSFPIYFLILIIARAVTRFFAQRQQKNEGT